jgi:hypothetical protein
MHKFRAQVSRVIIVVVQVGAVKIYVPAVEALMKKERGDETQFIAKIGGKLVWVPIILFYKISFPATHLMPCYPLFQWYPQSKEILLNLSVKC